VPWTQVGSQEAVEAAVQLLRAKQKAEEEGDEYRTLDVHLKEEVERLRRGLIGQKAEQLPRNRAQLSFALLALAISGAGATEADTEEAASTIEEQLVKEHTRRKPVHRAAARAPAAVEDRFHAARGGAQSRGACGDRHRDAGGAGAAAGGDGTAAVVHNKFMPKEVQRDGGACPLWPSGVARARNGRRAGGR
jgi:transposase IS166 family protein